MTHLTAAPQRSAAFIGRRHAGLGMRRIWAGSIGLTAIQMCFDIGQTMHQWGEYRQPMLMIAAWVILLVSDLAVIVVTRGLGDHLPNWLYWLFVSALGIVCALDLTATWGFSDVGFSLTAAVSAAVSLILAAPTRSAVQVVIPAAAFTVGTGIILGLVGSMRPDVLHNAVFTLAQMLFPVVIAVAVVAALRAFAVREIDRVLTESAVAAPRLSVGMEASEQLARLDLAAESLLAAVADGRLKVPLTPDVAKRAGALATELRAHLLVSRSKTWLGLAIEESQSLRNSVDVDDPDRVAGLLGTTQRGELLASIWLIAESTTRSRAAGTPIRVEFGDLSGPAGAETIRTLPIRLTISHSTRTTIDSAVWERLARVGPYQEAVESDGIRIDIQCQVTVPRSAPVG